MRLSPICALFSFMLMLALSAAAGAATVTIDGAPVTGVIVHEGHILVPFRAPMEQLGATVVWVDSSQTGTAIISGRELVRAIVGSQTAYIAGNAKVLDVAPVLVEQLEYVPVEMLPEISNAHLTMSADGNSAEITDFDLAGVNAVGGGAGSADPHGRVLFVWLWLLPFSAVVCGVAYFYVTHLVNRNFAMAARRRRGSTPT